LGGNSSYICLHSIYVVFYDVLIALHAFVFLYTMFYCILLDTAEVINKVFVLIVMNAAQDIEDTFCEQVEGNRRITCV